MKVTVVTEPLFEPVTLTEVYRHLRLDPDGSPATHEHDSLLTGLITTARIEVEEYIRRSLIQKTLRVSVDKFGTGIELWYPPIIRVDRVEYYDGSNVLTTIDPSNYYITDDVLPEVQFLDSFASPTRMVRPDAVRVTYAAGYAPANSPALLQADYAANVPQNIKNAILLGIQLHYEPMEPDDREALKTTWEAMLFHDRILLSV